MEKSQKTLHRLERLRQLNTDRNWVNKAIYRLMYKEDLYIVAYERIKSAPGNMTSGSDGKTIDGISLNMIQDIIEDMRTEQFQFKPVRTVYFPKANGKMRKLGIPSTRDKIVQEVIHTILESIYDSPHGPYFHETSHGFRPNRSCHTALREIRGKWPATNWFLEGDIQACFDAIDHEVLVTLLRKKIQDERFLNLIWKLLRAGYLDLQEARHDSLAGTPQGGLASPILANVYLHELDEKVEEIRLRWERGGKRKHRNPLHRKLSAQKERLVKKGATRTKESRQLVQQIRSIPAVEVNDSNFIRVKYLRYADDWLIGICGPRTLAEQIKEELKRFLGQHLKLTLSEEKTRITHARKEQAHFLGTRLAIGREVIQRIVTTNNGSGRPIQRRSTGSEIVMTAPKDELIRKLHAKGFCTVTGQPTTKLGWIYLVLKTVYTRAGVELTDPQEGCKLKDIKLKRILRRTAMLRSQTVNTIHDLNAQGKSVQEIAQELDISRTTVRKYLKHPEVGIPKPRPPRPSKLDPFKEQITKWVMEDHCTNCEVLFERLQNLGYTGGISILKEYVHPLRPAVAGHAPVQRYETKPGEQVQFDWGEFVYEYEGKTHKFYGFTAILGYSRMRFVTFVKRCDTPTLIRCLMEAFEYFGGLTKVALTDRMKSVLLEMEENKPRWNPRFADFMVSIGVAARVCKPYTPQTKGKVERTVSHIKKSLWGGITFTDLDDLNRQAYAWCERINSRVHRTTHARPVDRLAQEKLQPLPQDFAWERFAAEERKVTWDGYVSYDGVLYGLPGTLQLAGKQVQVRERKGVVSVWSAGLQVFAIEKRPRSQESVPHADQWKTVASVSAVRRAPTPLGHLQPAPQVESRPLQEYDQFCGVATVQEVIA